MTVSDPLGRWWLLRQPKSTVWRRHGLSCSGKLSDGVCDNKWCSSIPSSAVIAAKRAPTRIKVAAGLIFRCIARRYLRWTSRPGGESSMERLVRAILLTLNQSCLTGARRALCLPDCGLFLRLRQYIKCWRVLTGRIYRLLSWPVRSFTSQPGRL